MPRPTYPALLTAKHRLSNTTIQLDFTLEGSFDFEAGQFVQLHFSYEGTDYKRSYSIANSPQSFRENQTLEVALSFVEGGIASRFFEKADIGTAISIGGPFGILTAPDSFSGRIILMGTGTGLAPYRSMIPGLKALARTGTEIIVIMGVRHRDDLIYHDDFKGLASNSEKFEYRVCFSREKEVDSYSGEYKGYVQNQFSALKINPDSDLVYLCGNPMMIDDALKELKETGLGPRQIKREKYIFSS